MAEEVEKKRNPLVGILREEWKHLGKLKKRFILYMFLFVIAGIIGLATPLLIGLIFNSIQNNISSMAELKRLILLIVSLLAIQIVFWLFHGTGRLMESLTGFSVYRSYKNKKIHQVLQLPIKWHKDNHSGDTIDKINRAGESVRSFSEYYTFEIVYTAVNIFGSLAVLFFFNLYIAIFALVFSLIIIIIIMAVDRKLIKYYKEMNKYSNKLGAAVFDYISNIITVVTLRLRKTVEKRIDEKILDVYPTHKKATILNELKWAIGSVALTFMTVVALSYYSYTSFIATGTIMIGTLYILYGYLQRVGDTFFQFASMYGGLVKHNARIMGAEPIEKAFEELREKEKIKDKIPKDWKSMEIKNLNFSYNTEKGARHLEKVNIKFHRGQKIALVGESGSGKSTVLALLRGLYDPHEGELYLEGEKIKNGLKQIKEKITLIPQEPEIFNSTLKYNITMDLHTKKDEVKKAVKMAQFSSVVKRLKKGLNTNVSEKGVSLSGGEKQRLALARGLLAAQESDILLLDEPTSSVDSMNELKIHENIFREFKKKTIFSSIHRLHLLGRFDYIYLFENGKVVGEGTFNELKKNIKFRRMIQKYKMTEEKDKICGVK